MKYSAGIMCYNDKNEVFLLHPGGPWKCSVSRCTFPKGEYDIHNEIPFDAALREFREETGTDIIINADTPIYDLGSENTKYKQNHIWMIYQPNATWVSSNSFSVEWPVGSGIYSDFPECVGGDWYNLSDAEAKVFDGLLPFIRAARYILNA